MLCVYSRLNGPDYTLRIPCPNFPALGGIVLELHAPEGPFPRISHLLRFPADAVSRGNSDSHSLVLDSEMAVVIAGVKVRAWGEQHRAATYCRTVRGIFQLSKFVPVDGSENRQLLDRESFFLGGLVESQGRYVYIVSSNTTSQQKQVLRMN